MNISIKSTGFKLTSAVEEYAAKKVQALEKYMKRFDFAAAEARVEVGKTTKHHRKGDVFRAEVNLTVNGRLFRAEEEDADLHAAIDSVHNELKRQLISFKEKQIAKRVRPSRRV